MNDDANTIREAIKAEAARLGFEVVRCDLRTGTIHLRKGTEVRGSGAYGRFRNVENAINDVRNIARNGMRLDRTKGTRYFAA